MRDPKHFADKLKRQIVGLYNAGKPMRKIMEEHDLDKSMLERWIKSTNATNSPQSAETGRPSRAGSSN